MKKAIKQLETTCEASAANVAKVTAYFGDNIVPKIIDLTRMRLQLNKRLKIPKQVKIKSLYTDDILAKKKGYNSPVTNNLNIFFYEISIHFYCLITK